MLSAPQLALRRAFSDVLASAKVRQGNYFDGFFSNIFYRFTWSLAVFWKVPRGPMSVLGPKQYPQAKGTVSSSLWSPPGVPNIKGTSDCGPTRSSRAGAGSRFDLGDKGGLTTKGGWDLARLGPLACRISCDYEAFHIARLKE